MLFFHGEHKKHDEGHVKGEASGKMVFEHLSNDGNFAVFHVFSHDDQVEDKKQSFAPDGHVPLLDAADVLSKAKHFRKAGILNQKSLQKSSFIVQKKDDKIPYYQRDQTNWT